MNLVISSCILLNKISNIMFFVMFWRMESCPDNFLKWDTFSISIYFILKYINVSAEIFSQALPLFQLFILPSLNNFFNQKHLSNKSPLYNFHTSTPTLETKKCCRFGYFFLTIYKLQNYPIQWFLPLSHWLKNEFVISKPSCLCSLYRILQFSLFSSLAHFFLFSKDTLTIAM